MLDAPPPLDHDVVACIATAAAHYNVDPQQAINRILRRNGVSGEVRLHKGKTELGIYGVDERVLQSEGGTGIPRERLKDDDCLNVSVGIYVDALERQGRGKTQPRTAAATPTTVNVTAGRRLPKLDARAEQCVDAAAAAYQLPANIFRAVLRTEGGWVGLKKRNTNGSYDMGPAQINTIHLPELSKHGITEQMLVHDACINIYVGAYRLKVEIERVGDLWRGVGNYHSRTPHLHQAYLARVRANL